MTYAVLILCVIAVLLVIWVIHLKMQMRSICRQLEKRMSDNSRNYIEIQLWDKDAIRLAVDINKCFIEEENAKISLENEEKNFRSMIANISHDLRTPLTSIKGYIQLLSASPLTEGQQRRLDVINKHTSELGDLVEHFFEYSYLLSAEPQLNLERFNITEEVIECLAAAVPQLESRHLIAEVGKSKPVFVMADREKSVRIIQNLIRNCLQHASGSVYADVTAEGEYAVIKVANSVKDPVKIDVERLFERFYTAEKSRGKSTGLGLSIVKLLSEQMGGNVSAELNESQLIISIILPLSK